MTQPIPNSGHWMSGLPSIADVNGHRAGGPLMTVSSTGRRNTSFKSLCRCFEV
jgi:hypothetical protein